MKEKEQKVIRTLVVEDMPFLQRAIKRALQKDPSIQVVGTAAHGKEALKALERLKPDVITMDVEMPEMDGITAIKHIMVRYPRPVVVVSGMAKSSKAALAALSLGAVDFVPKPGGSSYRTRSFNLNELCTIVKEVAAIDPTKIRRAKFHKRDRVVMRPAKRPDGLVVIVAQRGTMGFVIRLLAMSEGLKGAGLLVVSELDELVVKSCAEGLKGRVLFDILPAGSEVPILAGAAAIIPRKWEFSLTFDKKGVPLLRRANTTSGLRYLQDLNSAFNGSIHFLYIGNKIEDWIKGAIKSAGAKVTIYDPFERSLDLQGDKDLVEQILNSEFELQRVLEHWIHSFAKERIN